MEEKLREVQRLMEQDRAMKGSNNNKAQIGSKENLRQSAIIN